MKLTSFLKGSLGALLLGTGLLAAGSAQAAITAASYTWVGGNGNWNVASNWLVNGGPGTGVPTSWIQDVDYIGTGTATVMAGASGGAGSLRIGSPNPGSAAGLVVEGYLGVSLDLLIGTNDAEGSPRANVFVQGTGAMSAIYTTIGAQGNSSGNLTVKDSASFSTGTLQIGGGDWGYGTLTIQDNARVTSTNGITVGGNQSTSNGIVNLNGGTLETSGITKGVGTATLNFNGGTIKATVNQNNFFNGFSDLTLGSNGLTINTDGVSITATNAFTGSGGLTKTGDGSLMLGGSLTYTGETNVQGGLLWATSGTFSPSNRVNIASSSVLVATAMVVNAGNTVTNNGWLNTSRLSINGLVQGSGWYSGDVKLNTGGTFVIGTRGTYGDTVQFNTSDLSLHGGTIEFGLGASGQNDQLLGVDACLFLDTVEGGTVALEFLDGFYTEGAHSYNLLQNFDVVQGDFLAALDLSNLDAGWEITNLTWSFESNVGTLSFDLEQVPEPGTWALMMGGLGMLVFGQRLRRKGSAQR